MYHAAVNARLHRRISIPACVACLALILTACGPSVTEPCADIEVPAIGPPRIDLASRGVSRSNLVAWVEWLVSSELGGRHAGEAGADATAALLADQMKSLGLAAPASAYCAGFELLNGLDYNVVGYSDTAVAAGDSPVIVLGAHYDGQGKHPAGAVYPGADDNASGLAALLEVARSVVRRDPAPEGSAGSPIDWVFIALGGEEVGQVGAHAYLAEMPIERSRIRLMVNLDMVGRPWPGDETTGIGYQAMGESDQEVAQLLRQASQRSGVEIRPLASLGELTPTISDARVFAERMPTLLLSTALHEDHHEISDTPERIDYQQIERTVKLVLAMADILAGHR